MGTALGDRGTRTTLEKSECRFLSSGHWFLDFVIDFDVDAGMVKVEVARTRMLSNGRLVF